MTEKTPQCDDCRGYYVRTSKATTTSNATTSNATTSAAPTSDATTVATTPWATTYCRDHCQGAYVLLPRQRNSRATTANATTYFQCDYVLQFDNVRTSAATTYFRCDYFQCDYLLPRLGPSRATTAATTTDLRFMARRHNWREAPRHKWREAPAQTQRAPR